MGGRVARGMLCEEGGSWGESDRRTENNCQSISLEITFIDGGLGGRVEVEDCRGNKHKHTSKIL